MIETGLEHDISEMRSLEFKNYKDIKPESGMTLGESRFFWNNVFGSGLEKSTDYDEICIENSNIKHHIELHGGDTYYYDDHGNLYRVGKELAPNRLYELNGYIYNTDDKGRIISAEGDLHIKDREGRLPIRDSLEDIGKGDQFEDDDRGHLIGDQYDSTRCIY